MNEFKKGDRVWVHVAATISYGATAYKAKVLGTFDGEYIVRDLGFWPIGPSTIRVLPGSKLTHR